MQIILAPSGTSVVWSIQAATVTVGKLAPEGVRLLGTGFLVSRDGSIVTSRHVVGDDDKGLCVIPARPNAAGSYQDTTDRGCNFSYAKLREIDPIRDLAIISVSTSVEGELPRLGSFDETEVGDPLRIWGFPHATDGRQVLTLQTAIVGAKVLLGSHKIKLKHAIINSQARPGQSGSPVVAAKTGAIVGLLVGAYAQAGSGLIRVGNFDPAELHQTTHCISAEYIREML
jgi:S1-C subfamily serine protease